MYMYFIVNDSKFIFLSEDGKMPLLETPSVPPSKGNNDKDKSEGSEEQSSPRDAKSDNKNKVITSKKLTLMPLSLEAESCGADRSFFSPYRTPPVRKSKPKQPVKLRVQGKVLRLNRKSRKIQKVSDGRFRSSEKIHRYFTFSKV